MNLFVKIFSIYVMWLAAVPCDDGGVRLVKASYDKQIIKLDDTQNKAESDIDSCSFFCICNCCGAIFILSIADALCPPQSLSEKKFTLNVVKPFYMNFPLLRPPKAFLS